MLRNSPPAVFQSEPGSSPCGWSWHRTFTVTGEIPGHQGYGKHETVVLGPIVPKAQEPSAWGFDSDEEAAFTSKVSASISKTSGLISGSSVLTAKQVAGLRWLLARAEAYLEGAQETYDRWYNRDAPGVQKTDQWGPGSAGGAWPLSSADAITAFSPACAGHDFGEIVEVEGRGGAWLRCPTKAEIDQRPKDRQKIRAYLLDAVRHARCAQYGFWRITLYQRALAQWRTKHGIDDLASTPDATPHNLPGLGLAGSTTPVAPKDLVAPTVQPPPEEPADFRLPDPETLPPPDDLPDLGHVPEPPAQEEGRPVRWPSQEPVRWPSTPEGSPSPVGSEERSEALPRVILGAAGVGAAWLLLRRLF